MNTPTPPADQAVCKPPYRIDFALITLTGNLTRYLTLRPVVQQHSEVRARWFPIRTWVQDDWLAFLPGHLRVRARHLLDSFLLYIEPPPDALMIHAFETYYIYTLLRTLLRRHTIIVNAPDGTFYVHGGRIKRALMYHALNSTALFIPFSQFSADCIHADYPFIPCERIIPIHPGINLQEWPLRPYAPAGDRFNLLFVAGNLVLKGGGTLLDAFEANLEQTCDLDVATQSAYLPDDLRARLERNAHIHLHLDLLPGSRELKALYTASDAFVSPSKSDTSSWVALEALATGVPMIITPQGGIPEIIVDGETGLLIPPGDPEAIIGAVHRLQTDEDLRLRLIRQGRSHVEAHYDAAKNTDHMLRLIESLIDAQRQQAVLAM